MVLLYFSTVQCGATCVIDLYTEWSYMCHSSSLCGATCFTALQGVVLHDANVPSVIFDENERDCPFNQDLVTPLERFHNGHQNVDSQAYKLLGIYLDEHLSFDAYTNHLCKKLSRSLYCIKMAKNNINPPGLRALYFALIHSHLSYCPIILNCLTKSNLNKIEKIQKKAIRIICPHCTTFLKPQNSPLRKNNQTIQVTFHAFGIL